MKAMSDNEDAFRNERGSVILYVMMGVVLFAALGYAVTESMRQGDPSQVGAEKAKAMATEILQVSAAIRRAVQNVRIDGCDYMDISFENDHVSGYDHTPSAESGCQIFSGSGGGIPYRIPVEDWLDPAHKATANYQNYIFPDNTCVPGLGDGETDGCASDLDDSNEDLVLVLPFVKKNVCQAVNDRLGITGVDDDPPTDTACSYEDAGNRYQGSFTDGHAIHDSAGLLDGRNAGCYHQLGTAGCNGTDDYYVFYQVLGER